MQRGKNREAAWVIKPTFDPPDDAIKSLFYHPVSDSALLLLIAYLDSRFSCGYLLSLING